MAIIAFAILAVVIAGCSTQTATPVVSPVASTTPTPPAPTTATPAPAQASAQIKDFAFSPQEVRVAKGGTVTWTNLDQVTHTISFNGTQSPGLGNGGTYSKTFNETGTFDYICGIHTYMKGRVVVE